MSKLGKKMIAAVEEGVEIARNAKEVCPACGLNLALIGRPHNCRPRPKTLEQIAPDVLNSDLLQLGDNNPSAKVTTNTKVDNKSVDNKSNICQPKAIVVNQVDKYTSDRVFDGKRVLSPERAQKIKEGLCVPLKRGRGRPKIAGPRPWETEGISRQAWYKRRAKV